MLGCGAERVSATLRADGRLRRPAELRSGQSGRVGECRELDSRLRMQEPGLVELAGFAQFGRLAYMNCYFPAFGSIKRKSISPPAASDQFQDYWKSTFPVLCCSSTKVHPFYYILMAANRGEPNVNFHRIHILHSLNTFSTLKYSLCRDLHNGCALVSICWYQSTKSKFIRAAEYRNGGAGNRTRAFEVKPSATVTDMLPLHQRLEFD